MEGCRFAAAGPNNVRQGLKLSDDARGKGDHNMGAESGLCYC